MEVAVCPANPDLPEMLPRLPVGTELPIAHRRYELLRFVNKRIIAKSRSQSPWQENEPHLCVLLDH